MPLDNLKSNKYIQKIIAVFSQGLTPKEIVLSTILGVLIGIMPILGLATIMVTFLALRFRLNLAVAILFSYVSAPLQVYLFTDFIHFGERLLVLKETLLTFESLKLMYNQPFLKAFKDLWIAIGCGLIGWCAVAVPIFIIIYVLSNKKTVV